MILALRAGKKTRTRRLVLASRSECDAPWEDLDIESPSVIINRGWGAQFLHLPSVSAPGVWHSVYSRVREGDVLWVREKFAPPLVAGDRALYAADYADGVGLGKNRPWSPSIFMPRDLCRMFLRVTGVRVERLQAITDAECVAEGIAFHPKAIEAMAKAGGAAGNLRIGWQAGWDAINPEAPWALNPWVWVYEFEVTRV